MAYEDPKKTTKTVPLTGTLEQSVRGYKDAKKAATRRAFAQMAGRAPTEAQQRAAGIEEAKAFAPVLREIGAVEGRIYDSDADKRRDQVALARSYATAALNHTNTRLRTATDAQKAKLTDKQKYWENVLKGLEYMEGQVPRGQRILNDKEATDQFKNIVKYATGKNPNTLALANMFASAFGNKEQRDEYISLLGEQFSGFDLATLEQPADDMASLYNRTSTNMGVGLTREVTDLTPELLTELGIDITDDFAQRGFAAGVQLAADPRAHYASYMAQGPSHPTGFPDPNSVTSESLAHVALTLTGGDTANLEDAARRYTEDSRMTPEQMQEMDAMSGYRHMLLQTMALPDAPDAVRQAQVQLLADPNYQAFKKSRGYETDKIAVRDLMKMLRKTDRGRKKRDRMRSKEFRKTGYRDQKTQKVFEALRSQEAETSKKGTDSADLTQGATSVEDVSDFTKGVASRNPLGIGTKR